MSRSPRQLRSLALAALATASLVTGCGGGGPRSTTTSPTALGVKADVQVHRSVTAFHGTGGIAYANCMRANGVPNFPDPRPGGGFNLSTAPGLNPGSPSFENAQATCQKYLGAPPGGPGSGDTPQQRAQTLAKLQRIAVCMRAHGISQFPDPSLTPPQNPRASGASVITDFDGVFLAFPSTLTLESPAYRKALTACNAPPLGLPH